MNYEDHVVEGLTRRSVELAKEWLRVAEQPPASTLWHAQDMTCVVRVTARSR